ncbi:hypothetical protein B0A48_11717 [Cryoendolithus antarcticus]|uniref:Uncharacterized protein n=1 Tax=Cryoendolithus antarcticus TaxID=1507870 RepID=A0A1V8SSK7_9PEZI|nr:hypothetical protein B0A48_11717 [Cryoendolithus antarcticus]
MVNALARYTHKILFKFRVPWTGPSVAIIARIGLIFIRIDPNLLEPHRHKILLMKEPLIPRANVVVVLVLDRTQLVAVWVTWLSVVTQHELVLIARIVDDPEGVIFALIDSEGLVEAQAGGIVLLPLHEP